MRKGVLLVLIRSIGNVHMRAAEKICFHSEYLTMHGMAPNSFDPEAASSACFAELSVLLLIMAARPRESSMLVLYSVFAYAANCSD